MEKAIDKSGSQAQEKKPSVAAQSFQLGKEIASNAIGADVTLKIPRKDTVYKGEIIGKTDIHAIQKLTDKHAVAHFLPKDKDLKEAITTGSENVFAYDKDGKQSIYPTARKTSPFRAGMNSARGAASLTASLVSVAAQCIA